ncbi:MAG: DUF4091 domain-containing protein [Clostridiaceae bacterium]|nr:DUF4091 domain-containing protein [Clostridiaceae bacterium]
MFEILPISSLERVFMDLPFEAKPLYKATMLKNEYYSFQFAYKLCHNAPVSNMPVKLEVAHDLGDSLSVRFVDYVPCDLAMYDNATGVLEHPWPGLFPDILRPMPKQLWAFKNNYRSVWITINGENIESGTYTITAAISSGDAQESASFELKVLDKELPRYDFKCTNWFHTDCLCNYYNIEFNSEEYWKITEEFAKEAARHGVNMLLTPIFTPPLDTRVGGERRTIQLVDVYKNGDSYSFNFDKLARWVDMCKRSNIEYYEISHLFTQWGCKHAPKIMGYENGEYKKLFGWETDAHGSEYRSFLSQLLPELVKVLKDLGIADNCYFHVSDEPNLSMLEDYKSSAMFLKEHLKGFKMFDALSSIEFYKEGLVTCPIPSLDHLGPFLEENIEELWTYYCCGQVTVSNRFLAFPSSRNRLLGLILFKYDIKGFLQWGLNFYNSWLSIEEIDPFTNSTGGGWVPGGDTFVLYPNEDGKPLSSIRSEVFREALQDMRALKALSDKIGRENVLEIIGGSIKEKLSYKTTDIKAEELIGIRERVNMEL